MSTSQVQGFPLLQFQSRHHLTVTLRRYSSTVELSGICKSGNSPVCTSPQLHLHMAALLASEMRYSHFPRIRSAVKLQTIFSAVSRILTTTRKGSKYVVRNSRLETDILWKVPHIEISSVEMTITTLSTAFQANAKK
jgi:hypothetical protein